MNIVVIIKKKGMSIHKIQEFSKTKIYKNFYRRITKIKTYTLFNKKILNNHFNIIIMDIIIIPKKYICI